MNYLNYFFFDLIKLNKPSKKKKKKKKEYFVFEETFSFVAPLSNHLAGSVNFTGSILCSFIKHDNVA